MKCHNSNRNYTGKENTPLGKGYHAEGEKLGSEMTGKDKKKYVVVNTKSGKRWQLKKTSQRKTSPRRKTSPQGLDEPSRKKLDKLQKTRDIYKNEKEMLTQMYLEIDNRVDDKIPDHNEIANKLKNRIYNIYRRDPSVRVKQIFGDLFNGRADLIESLEIAEKKIGNPG